MINSEKIVNIKEIPELLNLTENRPWGYFKKFCENTPVTVKIIVIHSQESLSLQSHDERTEFWRVISGEGTAEINGETQLIKMDDEIIVPIKTKHRLTAGANDLKILEIAFGDFDENDILRYSDKYGRI
jgi:mannose-6-phosphate isomerase-like protein (cupin superfamily)